MRGRRALGATTAAALALAGCGGGGDGRQQGNDPTKTVKTVVTVKEKAAASGAAQSGGLDPQQVYRDAAPGVVTVVSLFEGSGLGGLLGGEGGGGGGRDQQGVGSGFVLNEKGDIATNAHVVTDGQGARLKRAQNVYVQFGDDNRVPAKIIGTDANVDVALIRVDPKGLNLKPLPLGESKDLSVGQPVAAIGSPFNEPQSLSIGVISALDRTIESLAGRFGISGAIQTDAAINHGNSGGPLLDAEGRVLGINSQIQSTGGGGEGVGFAVPVSSVKRSLDQLREDGKASYAYLGVSSVGVYPQLAERFDLPVKRGAWLQEVSPGGPARKAGLEGGDSGEVTFQAARYKTGGDVVTEVDGQKLRQETDLSEVIAAKRPGDTVELTVYSGQKRKTVDVKLGSRPAGSRG